MKLLLLLLQLVSLCVIQVSCHTTDSPTSMPPSTTTTSAPSTNATSADSPTSMSPSTTITSAPSTNATSANTSSTTTTSAQLPSSTTPGFTFPVVGSTTTVSINTTASDGKVAASSTTVAMTTMSTEQDFVTSVWPVYGPMAGGTRVNITGQGLDASTIVAVHFGQHRVVDFSVKGNSVIAMTPRVNETAQNLSIKIEFLNQSTPIDTGFMFDYRPNPTMTDMQPKKHLLEGGTTVTVSGGNLNSVAEPRIIFTTVVTYTNGTNVTRMYYSEPCQFPEDGNIMTCVIPRFVEEEIARERSDGKWNATNGPGVAAFVATDGSQRLDVYIGLQFDGYEGYKNVSEEFPGIKFEFPPPPTVSCTSDVIEVDPDEEDTVISIKGENLMRASSKEDFRITIGDGVCVVTNLMENRVDCKPPSTEPNKKDDDTHCDGETMTLEVMIGNVHYQCSCVRYLSEDDLDLGMIIGVCIVVFIVVLFIIFLIFVLVECVFCGRRQKKPVEPDDANL